MEEEEVPLVDGVFEDALGGMCELSLISKSGGGMRSVLPTCDLQESRVEVDVHGSVGRDWGVVIGVRFWVKVLGGEKTLEKNRKDRTVGKSIQRVLVSSGKL
ncbi:hypothetical protein Tco_0017599 [Tanacetum coccineum]